MQRIALSSCRMPAGTTTVTDVGRFGSLFVIAATTTVGLCSLFVSLETTSAGRS